MKIAISSTGTSLDSKLDPRFGRASYFIIYDDKKEQVIDIIDNRTAQDAAHGAGINAATVVAQTGAEVVLTGRVGPKAFSVLSAAGIKVMSEQQGTVQEVLDKYLSGNLEISDGPDVDGHLWSSAQNENANKGYDSMSESKSGCKKKGMGKGVGKGNGQGQCSCRRGQRT